MLQLYSAEICPYAQRTRALLGHLDVPFELQEIDLDDRDPEFLRMTPTGKVPLLIEDGLILYESRVINEYLAESRGWQEALADEPGPRARQRLAMKQWDAVVLPPFYRSLEDPEAVSGEVRARVTSELERLDETVRLDEGGGASLLAFHCATFWARMTWLEEYTPLVDWAAEFPELSSWLDGAVELPAVEATLPDRAATVRRYEERVVAAASSGGPA